MRSQKKRRGRCWRRSKGADYTGNGKLPGNGKRETAGKRETGNCRETGNGKRINGGNPREALLTQKKHPEGLRFPFPVSRFPFPVSRFPFPVSRFPFPGRSRPLGSLVPQHRPNARPVPDTELRQDALDVVTGGEIADAQLVRDLVVR